MSQVAPPDAVVALAETLNRRLAEMQDPNSRSKRSWFQLFNHMDGDGTGRITYSEFEGVVRKELQFSPKELPSGALATVWAALDTDSTGFVGAGEFGAFMRRGEHAISRINPKDARLAIALQLRATLEAEGTQRRKCRNGPTPPSGHSGSFSWARVWSTSALSTIVLRSSGCRR